MEKQTLVLGGIYLIINAFIAGAMYQLSRKEGCGFIVYLTVVMLITGLPMLLVADMGTRVNSLWQWLGRETMFRFWLGWYFTRRYKNWSKEKLKLTNERVIRGWANKRPILKKQIAILNKRYNYIHTPDQEIDVWNNID